MINFSQLFQPSYLFSRFAATISPSMFRAWLIGGVVLLVVATVIRILVASKHSVSPVWANWLRRVVNMLTVMGIVALVLLFFRVQAVPIFSMRALMVAWVIGFVAWAIRLAYDAKTRVPQQLSSWHERQRINKYLPKK